MKPDSPLTATQLDLYQSYAAHDPDKLTHSERRLVATLAALRTQLEQAQEWGESLERGHASQLGATWKWKERAEKAEARETAVREALAEIEKYADSFLNTHLDHYSLREISKQAGRALSGEQGKTI